MATFTVTTTEDVVNAGDGVLSLREAVSQANATAAADTIVFASAIEGQTLVEDRTLVLTGGELSVSRDLTIDGDQNNDGTAITISGHRASRILDVTGTETDISLHDLTITGGRTEGDGDEFNRGEGEDGGAIKFIGRNLSVDNLVLSENEGYGFGGAIYFKGSAIKIENSEFSSNNSARGGAIFVSTGNILISSSDFVGNDGNYGGGAMESRSSGETFIQGSNFLHNFAFYDGGALDLSGNLTLENSQVSYNRARGTYGFGSQGGGIECASAVISGCTISDNSADFGGGIHAFGELSINNSTIVNNYAGYYFGGSGGGIRVRGDSTVINNSTITGNTAGGSPYGGGVGGGISPGSGTLEITNSIVAGNSVSGVGAYSPEIYGTITRSNGHNIFGSDVAGNVAGDLENVAASRLFAGGLADNGGPTPTMALRDAADNPALAGADPADSPATDQRGVARPLPTGTNPDIGAFELNQTTGGGPTLILGTNRGEVLLGTEGPDLMRGFGGNDTLRGFGGADQLFGGAGNDVLYGKGGIDRLQGDAGADRFAFRLPSDAPVGGPGYDEILDFSRYQGDRIDLREIDADVSAGGNQAFRFIGDAPFTRAGQVHAEATTDGDFLVSGNVDRDLDADFAFVVHTGVAKLVATDFLL